MDWKHPKRWFRISLVAVLLWFSLTQIIVVVKATHVCVTHVWAWFRNGELGLAFWFFVVGAIILFGAINAVPWILNRRYQILKNKKLQMILGGIVLGGLLACGIFFFASPTQRAYANGDCATKSNLLLAEDHIIMTMLKLHDDPCISGSTGSCCWTRSARTSLYRRHCRGHTKPR